MLLACPTCATAFRVPAEAFASAARSIAEETSRVNEAVDRFLARVAAA